MSSPNLEPNSELNEICETKPNERARKRTRNPEKHKIFQKEIEVQKGLEHETKSGKVIKPKIFYEQTSCDCKMKCVEKIGTIRQKQIFESFYGLENWSKKTLYLRSVVKKLPDKVNINSVKCISKKTKYKYFLINSSGEHEEVCHIFFLQCLQVPSSSVYRAIKSAVTNELANESRGKFHSKKSRKGDLKFLKKIIRKFPCYSSHYGSSQSKKKYLNPNMNIK